jgi:hypothetical protein
MQRMTQYKLTPLCKALIGIYSIAVAGQVLAAPNYYTGAGADVTLDSSWSTGAVQDSANGANIINQSSPPASWDFDASGNSYFSSNSGLYVGYGANQTGVFNITAGSSTMDPLLIYAFSDDPDRPALDPYQDPPFRVGDAGGHGIVNIDLSAPPASGFYGPTRIWSSSGLAFGLGLGSGSDGQLNILGAGKTTQDFFSMKDSSTIFLGTPPQNVAVGQNGGHGKIRIDSANLYFQPGEYNYSGNPDPLIYFAVGDNGGVGSVDIMGSGMLTAGPGEYGGMSSLRAADLLPFNYIGNNHGTGTVTVWPSGYGAANPPGGIASQAFFLVGLAVGRQGGNGALDIQQGGKSWITNGFTDASAGSEICSAADPSNYPVPNAPLLISADGVSAGSKGLVRASGEATQLLVAGFTPSLESTPAINDDAVGRVEIGKDGILVTADKARVEVGIAKYQPNTSGPPDYEQYFSPLSRRPGRHRRE